MSTHKVIPPVTPFSLSHELKAWIAELEAVEYQSDEHLKALQYAWEWLKFAECRERYKPKANSK